MFNRTPREQTGVEEAIDGLLKNMSNADEATPEYAAMVDQLVKLHALKMNENRPRISPDTMANVVANLAGIFIIVGHERAHIVTSKALAFIKRTG